MTVRKLTAADAVMLLPAKLDRDRVIDALAWLGISRDVIGTFTSVTIQPDRVLFELLPLADDQPRHLTVEAVVPR